jgi:hypothetical protein
LQLFKEDRLPILNKIALNSGAGLSDQDMKDFDYFADLLTKMTHLSHKRNCLLYVDAEQSYVQRAIESFG